MAADIMEDFGRFPTVTHSGRGRIARKAPKLLRLGDQWRVWAVVEALGHINANVENHSRLLSIGSVKVQSVLAGDKTLYGQSNLQLTSVVLALSGTPPRRAAVCDVRSWGRRAAQAVPPEAMRYYKGNGRGPILRRTPD